MIHHYITKYIETFDNNEYKFFVESWIQLNIFGQVYCFSRRREEIKKDWFTDWEMEMSLNEREKQK